MSSYSIARLNESDIEEFVQCQFVAFVGNSLHDVVYPTPQHSVDAQRNVFATTGQLPEGTEIVYLKAVDDATGKIIGGIKVCYYGSEDLRTTSPYPAGKSTTEEGLSDEEQYTRFVFSQFLGRRRKYLMYPHSLIDLLFVHPDHGRKGVGKELVAHSCALGDEKGLPGIVEASPQGKRTYEKCGFVDQGAITITSERWPGKDDNLYYWMERKASTS